MNKRLVPPQNLFMPPQSRYPGVGPATKLFKQQAIKLSIIFRAHLCLKKIIVLKLKAYTVRKSLQMYENKKAQKNERKYLTKTFQ